MSVTFTIRGPRLEEAEAATEMLNEHSRSLHGADDTVSAELRQYWESPDVDFERDVLLAEASDGSIIGYADVGVQGDHVWLDHLSFAGFGRGAVVLSGTRVSTSSTAFYTYRDCGWMTFSWIAIDASEKWRCSGAEDSPYPFFTTNDPSLTFDHALFQYGHGRNPAIDGESAHFINSAWLNVTDGLDGRGSAKLLVEGSYFDGKNPIRMDDPLPPTVLAPWDANTLTDKRRQNIFSAAAWSSIVSDWGNRKLDLNTLNTNSVPLPTYPYALDPSPNSTQATVTAGAGVGKGAVERRTCISLLRLRGRPLRRIQRVRRKAAGQQATRETDGY